jgi:phage regulator Rha-like protein
MGFTGSEALKFKLAYIAEFNRMEAELNARIPNVGRRSPTRRAPIRLVPLT